MHISDRLAKSKFRSRFKLRKKELEYIKDKGLDKIRSHACDFIRDRVAPSESANDGKQTPMRGHPVFIAQHATATCFLKILSLEPVVPAPIRLSSLRLSLNRVLLACTRPEPVES